VRPEFVAEVEFLSFSPGRMTICCVRQFTRVCREKSRRARCAARCRIRNPLRRRPRQCTLASATGRRNDCRVRRASLRSLSPAQLRPNAGWDPLPLSLMPNPHQGQFAFEPDGAWQFFQKFCERILR
jgi:hypothetical protein